VTDIRWSETAFGDLESIRDYIRHDSPAYAYVVVSRLYDAVDQLRRFPTSGRVVPERGDPSLRELIRPPYRIVYLVTERGVEILTVFHAKRLFGASAET
jgi:plasmid stabilization system protein ParE